MCSIPLSRSARRLPPVPCPPDRPVRPTCHRLVGCRADCGEGCGGTPRRRRTVSPRHEGYRHHRLPAPFGRGRHLPLLHPSRRGSTETRRCRRFSLLIDIFVWGRVRSLCVVPLSRDKCCRFGQTADGLFVRGCVLLGTRAAGNRRQVAMAETDLIEDGLAKASKPSLSWVAERLGVDTSGHKPNIAGRIVAHLRDSSWQKGWER